MPDIIIAKIQNRRGLRVNLPQPLDPGEIGLCLDTNQVFIGLDVNDPNSAITPLVVVFTPSTQTTASANAVCDTQIVQIDLFEPVLPDDIPTLEQEIANAASVPDDQVVVVIYNELGGARAYVGYSSAPGTPGAPPPPTLDPFGNTRWFGSTTANTFVEGVLDMSSNYIPDDAFSIAYLINKVYKEGDSVGLVTVNQNLEILTSNETTFPPDMVIIPLEFPSTARGGFGPILDAGGNPLSYSIEDTDCFDINYSVKGAPGITYTRIGKMSMVADETTALMTDQSSEINPNSVEVSFQANKNGENVEIYYKSTIDMIFSTITKRWKSF